MCKCLSPVEAWICGKVVAKDGVTSPHVVFSFNKAREYFEQSVWANMFFRLKYYDKHFTLSNHDCFTIALDEWLHDHSLSVPCGHCSACQLCKRKDMSVRLAHEASCHSNSCFITLTYDDDNLPHTANGSPTLCVRDVQLFIKRLRRHLEYVPKKASVSVRDHVERIRYFVCGEYGSKSKRPHYHVLIFGWTPSDGKLLFVRKNNQILRSAQIEKNWRYGFSSFTSVSPFVAKYCARYVTKKFARLSDSDVSFSDDELCNEFILQSVKDGGIGSLWLDKYRKNLGTGFVTVKCGDKVTKHTIPQYYYSRLRRIDKPFWIALRDARIAWLSNHPSVASDFEALKRSVDHQAYVDSLNSSQEVF